MQTTPNPPEPIDGGPDAPDAPVATPDRPIDDGGETIRVVGIGASAGGLEAFERFFSAMPPDTGLAFVVVQHLDPTKTGMLPELLQRLTSMAVVEAEDGVPIEPNRVHIIPSDRSMTVEALRERVGELQRSNEDLERFAYVSSHDLQEPIRTIVSFSQLLERCYRGRLEEDADEFIGFIVEAGTRMQHLIKDLLLFSQISTGRATLCAVESG